MINVLYVYGDILRRGGMESHMMNYFRYINREKIHIDFAIQSFNQCGGLYDDEIRKKGSEIYILPKYHVNPLGYIMGLCKLFLSGRYQIVHAHCDAMNYRVLLIAKICGIPVRIAHSHNTQHILKSPIKMAYYEYCRKNQSKFATDLWACSQAAGEWLFGNCSFTVIPNAIESDRFVFDETKREQMRKNYGLTDTDIVLGHIGRFDYQKNHLFLLNILEKLKNVNYKLLLVGEGDMRKQIEQRVNYMGISSRVIFVGAVADPQDYYQMMDLFLFPSQFEGFGTVILEAQANGLKCLVSNAVPKEANLFGNVTYRAFREEEWIKYIKENAGKRSLTSQQEITDCGYNIKIAAKMVSDKYTTLVQKNVNKDNKMLENFHDGTK